MTEEKTLPRVFQAYGRYQPRTGNTRGPARPTPRQAAVAFFELHPTARKVTVQEYAENERGFLTYSFAIGGGEPNTFQTWRDLSKPAALALPDEPSKYPAAFAPEAVAS